MSYDFGRNSLRHKNELAKLLSNPDYSIFVPASMHCDYLNEKVFMVCMNCNVKNSIWLTKGEAQQLDKRILAAIERHLNEILYDLLPDEDDEFFWQNGILIREVVSEENWD